MKNWVFHLILALILLALAGPAFAAQAESAPTPLACGDILKVGLPSEAAGTAKWNLCSLMEAGELNDLRWPNFEDYREEVENFYQSSDHALAWIEGAQPSAQARKIIALFQEAEQKGLRAEDYDASRWNDRLAQIAKPVSPSASDLARFDLALTISAMRYISDLHNGRINPHYFQFGFDIERKKYNLAEFLRTRVLAAQDLATALEQVEPSYPGYRRTKTALEQYLAMAQKGEGEPLPMPEDSIKPGDAYVGVPQLAQRLKLLGDLPQDTAIPAGSNRYDGALINAVKHFQQRHGLTPDGAIGHNTFHQIVTPLSRRIIQLQLTLERWRWLGADPRSRFIVVNIPEFQLHAYSDRRPPVSMRVVVGQAFDHQTPTFEDQMRYIIFRPYWNVPDSIVQQELLPALRKNWGYLAKHQYEIVNNQGEVFSSDILDPKLVKQLETKKLQVRQKPGPTNSLGLAKFVFPNHYDVYLHGTPERGLFARTRRDFSHGCIRVENPAALAAWVLHDDSKWTGERIRTAMNGTESLQVNLPRPIPVFILYGTAMVEENGEVRFFDDIYGHDAALESALANGYPYPHVD
jgi:murein L,D-transpeptidase YcbB/YkuD